MSSTQNDAEVLKQLTQAWDEARRQLSDLRTRVELTRVLAEAKISGDILSQDLDRAYKQLGEAAFEAVEKGQLKVSSSLTSVIDAIRAVQAERKAHQQAVMALLQEGNELANRLNKKASISEKTDLATKGKKG